ncbi:CG34028, partial [Drosophila busckii]
YRSNTGNEEDYTLMPWSVPKQTYEEYTKSFYESIVHKNLAHCSNLPTPDKAYPIPKGTVYKFDRCVVDGDGMPDYAPDGYYKVVFNATGEVEWTVTIIVKITKKTD